MDVSTCLPFGCKQYTAFRSHIVGFGRRTSTWEEHRCPQLSKTPARPGLPEDQPKKLITSKRSRYSKKHMEGNTNKKLLKEINAKNAGEITSASHSTSGCFLALSKLTSCIFPNKAGFINEFQKSEAQGQEIAPQNAIH